MEISDSIKKGLEIVQVSRMDEVLARAMPEFTWDKRIVWRDARSIMNTNHALISMVQTAFVYMSAVRQRLAELGQEIPPREQQTPEAVAQTRHESPVSSFLFPAPAAASARRSRAPAAPAA